MKQSENLFDPHLEVWFSSLRTVPSRPPQAVQRGRREFLAQVRSLSIPVSKTIDRRLNRWQETFRKHLNFKEYSPMYATIASFILILALMFGGTGATVLAAQGSLPDQPLYQVKTFAEDLALRSTLQNELRLQMVLEYAGLRVTEMNRLREMDMAIPETAYQRLQLHLDQALGIAAQSGEKDMIRLLEQIRERLQAQIQELSPGLEQDPLLSQAREMIQSRLSWAEMGLDEPEQFRLQVQVRSRFSDPPQVNQDSSPGPGPAQAPGAGEQGFSPGPQEPAPKNEDCPNDSCTPKPENSFGPGPNAEGDSAQPGPGPNSGDENPGPGPGGSQEQESWNGNNGGSSNPDSNQGEQTNKNQAGKP